MKKIVILSIVCLILSGFSFAAFAENSPTELNDVTFIIDFEPAAFSVNPILHNGRMLLPMREFFEAIGADLEWCELEKQITAEYDGNQITLTIDRHTAHINGSKLMLDVSPTLLNGSTYIPVRFAGESLGYEIIWSNAHRAIYAFSDAEGLDLTFIPELKEPIEKPAPVKDGLPAGTEIIDTFSGTASWYGGQFHGRRTSSGEVFDQYALTAAHRTLAFGTFVKVTHTSTNKSVIVKINDRGPHIRGRILDLSMASADLIGLKARGLSEVVVEVLGNYQK